MHLTAYETLACRAYNQDIISANLKRALVEDDVLSLQSTSGQPVSHVWGISEHNSEIPTFSHPFRIEVDNVLFYFIDTRAFMKENRDGSMRFTNVTDYQFQLTRAILNAQWETEPRDLVNTGELGPLVFCRWLSEAIVRRLGLGPAEQAQVMTITLFFWHSLFREGGDEFEEKEKMRILTRLNQISSIPTNLSMAIVDEITVMPNITSYTEALIRIVNSSRLEKLTPALLFAMLGGSWFGFNAKETIAVATEHPPTFLSIVASSLSSRSYRKTILGRLVFENDKRGRGDTFSKNIQQVLSLYLGD